MHLNSHRMACFTTNNSYAGHQSPRGDRPENCCWNFKKKLLAFHTASIYTNGMKKSTKISKNFTSFESSLHHLDQRHRVLLAELEDIGLVLRGSIELRLNRCGNPTCRCKADPPMLHGPYYKWTRKVAGKTVNATLTPEQAARFKDWVQNMRNLDQIVRQLQDIGLEAAELLSQPCPPLRPRRP